MTRVGAEAQELAIPGRLEFAVGDLREWGPAEPVDVLVTNATLQWVPGHLDLLPQLTSYIRAGGWFAAQLPGNFGEPTHTTIDALLAEPRWRVRFADVVLPRPASAEPADYLAVLTERASVVDVWETTYLHELTEPALVARGGAWFRGPGVELHLGVEDDFRPARKAHPGLLVADLTGLVARLESYGLGVRWDGDFPGYRRCYVDDPHGNRLELLEPVDG